MRNVFRLLVPISLLAAAVGCGERVATQATSDPASDEGQAMAALREEVDAALRDGTASGAEGGSFQCPQGGCLVACGPDQTCDSTCTGGGCAQICGPNARCGFECGGGGCHQSCRADATCDFSCNAGGCEQECRDGAGACEMTCVGGGCRLL